MNSNDLILNIGEAYKDCDDRLVKLYRKEFDNYPSSKLEKVWDVIQENHSFARAPELGSIFKYMFTIGLSRTKQQDIFHNRCTQMIKAKDKDGKLILDADKDAIMIECNTKYSTKSKFCPKCNSKSRIEEELQKKYEKDKPIFNSYEVVKCNTLPNDLRILNELCATCSKFQDTYLVRGSKCNAWNSHDDYKKTGKKCDDCPCFKCCNEKPMNGIQHATMRIKRIQG